MLLVHRYLVSLIASDSEGVHTDLNEFGLEAMNVALNAGGAGDCKRAEYMYAGQYGHIMQAHHYRSGRMPSLSGSWCLSSASDSSSNTNLDCLVFPAQPSSGTRR